MWARTSASGTCTANTIAGPGQRAAASGAISAPAAANSASAMEACAPAPDCTATVMPRAISFLTVSGVAATRVSAAAVSFSTARRMNRSLSVGNPPRWRRKMRDVATPRKGVGGLAILRLAVPDDSVTLAQTMGCNQ